MFTPVRIILHLVKLPVIYFGLLALLLLDGILRTQKGQKLKKSVACVLAYFSLGDGGSGAETFPKIAQVLACLQALRNLNSTCCTFQKTKLHTTERANSHANSSRNQNILFFYLSIYWFLYLKIFICKELSPNAN